jgi:hypothetical protein
MRAAVQALEASIQNIRLVKERESIMRCSTTSLPAAWISGVIVTREFLLTPLQVYIHI